MEAGTALTDGENSVFVGEGAGIAVTGGNANVCVGQECGSTITTGSGNIIIGTLAQSASAGVDQQVVIGYNITSKGHQTGFISPAGGAMYNGQNSTVWVATSDRRIKKNIVDNTNGLDIINQIRVRNFEYRLPEEVDAELPSHAAIDKEGIQLGAIAQEMEEFLPEVITTESTGVKALNADNLTWYLINAVKELSAKVEALENNKE